MPKQPHNEAEDRSETLDRVGKALAIGGGAAALPAYHLRSFSTGPEANALREADRLFQIGRGPERAKIYGEALGEYAERRNPGTVRKLPGVGAYRSGRSDVSAGAEEWLGEAPERA